MYTTHSKKVAWLIALITCAALLISAYPLSALAQEPIDTNRFVSVTLDTTQVSPDIESASFKLYKVAETTPDISLTLTDDFKAYPISFSQLSSEDYQALALTLAGYVSRDNLVPVLEGTTDDTGKLTFGKDSDPLFPGMYLLVGQSVATKNATYIHKPTLLFLPLQTDDKTSWSYSSVIKPKYDTQLSPTTSFVIQKVWKDDTGKEARPKSITVDVMCDNTLYDTVVLSEENAWKQSFKDLDATKTWTVSEREVKGYTTQVRFEEQTYLIENTFAPTPTPTPEPKPDQALPKTGMLIWPIFVFGVAGISLLGISRVVSKRERHNS